MPVQNYSSGMKVRLGFAVAAQMEPDVLIIDEVLAVGDLGFVLKCFKQIDSILPNTAIIFVSHSMPMVSRICNQIILLDKGQSKFQGVEVPKAIDLYYTRFSNNESNVVFDDGTIKLIGVELIGVGFYEGIPQLEWNNDLNISFKFKMIQGGDIPVFYVTIFDKEQRPVALLKPNSSKSNITLEDDEIRFTVKHENLQLSKGIYTINISVNSSITKEPLLRVNSVESLQIINELHTWPPFLLDAEYI
jgi:lipopolysaccharide transport system ATP-binding protein